MEAMLTIKLPEVLRRQTHSVADQRGQTISEIVRDALQQYLTQAQAERQTLADMYAEFAEEDRQLARAGLAHYAHVLAQEEKN